MYIYIDDRLGEIVYICSCSRCVCVCIKYERLPVHRFGRVSHSSSSEVVIRARERENDEYNRPEEEEEMTIPRVFSSLLFLASISSIVLFLSLSLYSFRGVSYIGLFSEETERER